MSPPDRRDAEEESDQPAGLDAAFEKITSAWREDRPSWPADDADDVDDADEAHASAMARPVPEPVDEEEHFVPPEPPPLPRPQPATVGAGLLFLAGILLVAVPGVVGLSAQLGLPLGLLAITGAIVWLAARLRNGPPRDFDSDDGAQV
jgi:hypothetical protein